MQNDDRAVRSIKICYQLYSSDELAVRMDVDLGKAVMSAECDVSRRV